MMSESAIDAAGLARAVARVRREPRSIVPTCWVIEVEHTYYGPYESEALARIALANILAGLTKVQSQSSVTRTSYETMIVPIWPDGQVHGMVGAQVDHG